MTVTERAGGGVGLFRFGTMAGNHGRTRSQEYVCEIDKQSSRKEALAEEMQSSFGVVKEKINSLLATDKFESLTARYTTYTPFSSGGTFSKINAVTAAGCPGSYEVRVDVGGGSRMNELRFDFYKELSGIVSGTDLPSLSMVEAISGSTGGVGGITSIDDIKRIVYTSAPDITELQATWEAKAWETQTAAADADADADADAGADTLNMDSLLMELK